MSRSSTLQELQEVRAAIKKIQNGVQSYTLDGQTYTYATLFRLHGREKELLGRLRTRIKSTNFGGVFS